MHDDSDVVPPLTRRALLRGAGGVVGGALAGCVGSDTWGSGLTSSGGGDGTDSSSLTYALAQPFSEFDPIVLNDRPSAEISQLLFEAPYEYDSELEVVPVLATDLPTVERGGQRWIVPLDGEATFQHGAPVTARDVVYSYTAPLEEGTENAAEVNMIDAVAVIDETTVQFDLEYEFGPFEHYLTRDVVPRDVREADRTAFNTSEPVGSGPYELQRATQGEEAVLRRRNEYWGEPVPTVDEIRFVPVTESVARVTTLQTGESDVIGDVPPGDWATVRDMDGARVESVPGVNYVYFAFNCNDGPTADPQVREAIDYAVSLDRAVSRFVEPGGERVYGPIPPAIAERWKFPLDEWQAIGHDRDRDRAKALLDDAEAVPDDWSARIIVPPDEKRESVAVSIANGIEAAGYDATVRRLDLPTFTQRYNTGSTDDYDIYGLGWQGAPDPDTFMYFLFGHDTIGTNNGTYFRDESLNRSIEAARRSTDRAERKALYEAAVRTVLEQRVHLPAYTTTTSFGVRDHVRDWLAHPIAQFKLASTENNVTIQ